MALRMPALLAIFCGFLGAIGTKDRHWHLMRTQLSNDSAPVAKGGLCGCAPVPEDQCTCDRSLEYLKCIEKRCGSGDCICPASPFQAECYTLSSTCDAELRLSGCDQSLTSCAGRFHQATDGVTGLTLDTSHLNDEALCGPFGRCTGELRLLASAHRQLPGAFLECVLPASAGQAHAKAELVHCARALSDDGIGECNLPMIARLDPEQQVNGRCYLTDGDGGPKLTKDAWFVVRNRYREDMAGTTSKKTNGYETKKRLKSNARKAREARLAEENAEAVGASKERSAKIADKELEEAGVESRKNTKQTNGGMRIGVVLLAVIAAIGAALIYLKSKKATT